MRFFPLFNSAVQREPLQTHSRRGGSLVSSRRAISRNAERRQERPIQSSRPLPGRVVGGVWADCSPLHIFRCSVGSKMTRARRFPSPRPGRLFSSVIVLTDEIAFVSLRSVFLCLISFCRARPRSRGPAPPCPRDRGGVLIARRLSEARARSPAPPLGELAHGLPRLFSVTFFGDIRFLVSKAKLNHSHSIRSGEACLRKTGT